MNYTIKPYGTNGMGWCVFPIIYKGIKYIVRLDPFYAPTPKSFSCCKCEIFEYREKWHILFGHYGPRVYKEEITVLNIDNDNGDNLLFSMDGIDEQLFRANLPAIMKSLFLRWEYEVEAAQKSEEAIQRSEQWDGIIS